MSAKRILGFERGTATLTKLDLNMASIIRSVVWMVSVHLQRAEETVSIQDIYSIYNLFTIHSISLSLYVHIYIDLVILNHCKCLISTKLD